MLEKNFIICLSILSTCLIKLSVEEAQSCTRLISQSTCIDETRCSYLIEIVNDTIKLHTIVKLPFELQSSECRGINRHSEYFCCKKQFAAHQLPDYNVCGQKAPVDRIAGGEITSPTDYLWHALLLYEKSGIIQIGCGGSLIAKRFVVTAAHCTNNKITEKIGKLVKVRLGEYDTEDKSESLILDYDIEKVVVHPQYSSKTKYDDIALISLKEDVDYNTFTPICFPKPDFVDSKVGDKLLAVGFGRNDSRSDKLSTKKQKVELPIYDSNLCSKPKRIISENQLCAGGETGKDTCGGDSGGCLSTLRGNNWILEGVVSYGEANCTAGFPGVYTRVRKYRNWILDTMRTILN